MPTLLVGGWQDLFIEQTLEQYRRLTVRGVPTRLVIGPWYHLELAMKGRAATAESLAWLDRFAGSGAPGSTGGTGGPDRPEHSVRVWVGGARQWRELAGWPPPGAGQQRWYLGAHGTLTTRPPAGPAGPDGPDSTDGREGTDGPGGTDGADVPEARFRYDPADPTPSVGGAIMAVNAGVRDNRAVEKRPDVLVFSSSVLDEPVEIVGEVTAELAVTRDNPHADLFVQLCDVDPRGRSRNVCDGIVRLTSQDPLSGTVPVSLPGVAHRFGRGHRIRVQIAGGAHPRFARNPGTGQLDATAADLRPTSYRIGTGVQAVSALLLPVPGVAAAAAAGDLAAGAAADAR